MNAHAGMRPVTSGTKTSSSSHRVTGALVMASPPGPASPGSGRPSRGGRAGRRATPVRRPSDSAGGWVPLGSSERSNSQAGVSAGASAAGPGGTGAAEGPGGVRACGRAACGRAGGRACERAGLTQNGVQGTGPRRAQQQHTSRACGTARIGSRGAHYHANLDQIRYHGPLVPEAASRPGGLRLSRVPAIWAGRLTRMG
jgi:hypothetical protein